MADSPPVPPTPPKAPKDAVIFVPGMGNAGRPDQSAEGVAKRIAVALEYAWTEATPRPHFDLAKQGREEQMRNGQMVSVRTVERSVGADPGVPVLDVYARDYTEQLTRDYYQYSLFMKCVTLALTIFQYLPKMIGSLRAVTGKTTGEKVQLLWAAFIMSLLWLYMVILLGAVVTTARQMLAAALEDSPTATQPSNPAGTQPGSAREKQSVGPTTQPTKTTTPADDKQPKAPTPDPAQADPPDASQAQPKTWWGRRWDQLSSSRWWGQAMQWAAVIGTLILSMWPRLQQTVIRAAVLHLCVIRYLNDGDQREALIGDFTAVLAHVAEPGRGYRRVYVIAYSFGTVITLDAVYPVNNADIGPAKRVDHLTTIGCPFDLIRTYWPHYFLSRYPDPDFKAAWVNVYSPADVLGSNFRDDRQKDQPERGVVAAPAATAAPREVKPDKNLAYLTGPAPEDLSWFQMTMLMALRAHGMYWDKDTVDAKSVYSLWVQEVFATDPWAPAVRPNVLPVVPPPPTTP